MLSRRMPNRGSNLAGETSAPGRKGAFELGILTARSNLGLFGSSHDHMRAEENVRDRREQARRYQDHMHNGFAGDGKYQCE